LVMNFDHTKTDQWSFSELTALGLQQYKAAFKKVTDDNFYSSTITQKWRPDSIHGLSEKYGKMVYLNRNYDPRLFSWVRCVINPKDADTAYSNLDTSFNLDDDAENRFDRALVSFSSGVVLSTGTHSYNTKSENPLKLTRRLYDGSLDKTFAPEEIPYYTNPVFAAWHRFRSGLDLNDGTALLIVQSGYNGAGPFRFAHIRKVDQNGKIDRKFGNKGVLAFESHSSKLNYRFVGNLVQQSDGKVLGTESRCVTEGNADYGNCENHLFRILPNGTFDTTFGSGGFVKLTNQTDKEYTFHIFFKNAQIGVVKAQERRIEIARFNQRGVLEISFGETGWKAIDISESGCSVKQHKALGQNVFIASLCAKTNTVALKKIDFDGNLDINFTQDGESGFKLSPKLGVGEIISAISVTPLKSGNVFLSYATSKAIKFPSSLQLFSVRGLLIEPTATINLSWGEMKFYTSEDLFLPLTPGAVFAAEQEDGKVLINVYDGGLYKGGVWLRSAAMQLN
jgi:hypothetical protein